jgi:hypothetical protein
MHAPVRPAQQPTRKSRRAFWFKQVYRFHWISSAISLVGLLLFAFTGITLNHAADIGATPIVTHREATVPPAVLKQLAGEDEAKRPLPAAVRGWAERELGVRLGGTAEWSPDEIYLALPQPGGDAWLSIDRATGALAHEQTDNGAISYLNDLHKGRNTGTAWAWFIDIFSGACFIFALTGLVLLQVHASKRRSTWPLVGAGLIIPLLLAIFFIH